MAVSSLSANLGKAGLPPSVVHALPEGQLPYTVDLTEQRGVIDFVSVRMDLTATAGNRLFRFELQCYLSGQLNGQADGNTNRTYFEAATQYAAGDDIRFWLFPGAPFSTGQSAVGTTTTHTEYIAIPPNMHGMMH